MGFLKKIFLAVISCCLIMQALPVMAEDNGCLYEDFELKLYQNGDFPEVAPYSVRTLSGHLELENDIVKALRKIDIDKNGYIQVNTRGYGFKVDEMVLIVENIINSYPEFFYVTNKLKYKLEENTGIVQSISFVLSCSKEEILKQQKEFNKSVDEIRSTISENMTDAEKALAVHDYIAANGAYDNEAFENNLDRGHNAYDMLVNKKGVCQAYALAYKHIMDLYGIPCIFVPSKNMNHAWNLVKLQEKWYHVDVTWDDPLAEDPVTGEKYDLPGRVNHNYFLLSDDVISDENHQHKGWESPYECGSDKYSDLKTINSTSSVVFDGESLYYMSNEENGGIYWLDMDKNYDNMIYKIEDEWKIFGSKYYRLLGSFSGMGFYNGEIYYNTPDSIRKFTPKGKKEIEKTEKVFTYSPKGNEYDICETYFFGMSVLGNEAYINKGFMKGTEAPVFYGEIEPYVYNLDTISPEPTPSVIPKPDNAVDAAVCGKYKESGVKVAVASDDNSLSLYVEQEENGAKLTFKDLLGEKFDEISDKVSEYEAKDYEILLDINFMGGKSVYGKDFKAFYNEEEIIEEGDYENICAGYVYKMSDVFKNMYFELYSDTSSDIETVVNYYGDDESKDSVIYNISSGLLPEKTDINNMRMYLGEYDEYGNLLRLQPIKPERQRFTAKLPESSKYKIMLWDGEFYPVIQSIEKITSE